MKKTKYLSVAAKSIDKQIKFLRSEQDKIQTKVLQLNTELFFIEEEVKKLKKQQDVLIGEPEKESV